MSVRASVINSFELRTRRLGEADSPAPCEPFRIPVTNWPRELYRKQPTPTRTSGAVLDGAALDIV